MSNFLMTKARHAMYFFIQTLPFAYLKYQNEICNILPRHQTIDIFSLFFSDAALPKRRHTQLSFCIGKSLF